jgi:hypothetical protein
VVEIAKFNILFTEGGKHLVPNLYLGLLIAGKQQKEVMKGRAGCSSK